MTLDLLRHFIPAFFSGFMVNLEIALVATLLGLVVGVSLAFLRRAVPRARHIVQLSVRLMLAAPTYVVMFLVLNLLPHQLALFGNSIVGLAAVILSMSVFMTAYVADNAHQALEHLHGQEREHALLFLPNLLRGFVLVAMSSGFGAAIGVAEAVSVTMQQAEQLQTLSDRIVLFLMVIAFFVTVFGTANALIRRAIRYLSKPAHITVASNDSTHDASPTSSGSRGS